MFKWVPKAIKIGAKNVRRSDFEIWGRFGGIQNLDGFGKGKRWTQNLKKSEWLQTQNFGTETAE